MTWVVTADLGEQITAVLLGADGVGFVATRGGSVLRSDDLVAWTAIGRVAAMPYVLEAAPRYLETREIVVGTSDGTFKLVDDGSGDEGVLPPQWGGYQYVDSASLFLEGCRYCPEVFTDHTTMTGASRVVEGEAIGTWLRGHTLRVHGWIDAPSAVEVWVDGALIDVLGEVSPAGVLATYPLADDMHRIDLIAVERSGLVFDGVDGTTASEPLLAADPVDTGQADTDSEETGAGFDTDAEPSETGSEAKAEPGGCGCAAGRGGAAASWLLLLTGIAFIERRRSSASA